MPPLLVVSGTLTLDTTERAGALHAAVPGGSALYAATAASRHVPVRMLGTIGSDFPIELLDDLTARGVDSRAVEHLEGPTFRWHARYTDDGAQRETIARDRGVAEGRLPPTGSPPDGPHALLLASTSPAVQQHVRLHHPHAVMTALDSMAHWWQTEQAALYALLPQVDLLFVDDEERRLATGHDHTFDGVASLLARGVRTVVVKGGSRGAWLVRREGSRAHVEAVLPDALVDTTGAGDAFAGALVAALLTGASDSDALGLACRTAAQAVAAVGITGLLVSPA